MVEGDVFTLTMGGLSENNSEFILLPISRACILCLQIRFGERSFCREYQECTAILPIHNSPNIQEKCLTLLISPHRSIVGRRWRWRGLTSGIHQRKRRRRRRSRRFPDSRQITRRIDAWTKGRTRTDLLALSLLRALIQ